MRWWTWLVVAAVGSGAEVARAVPVQVSLQGRTLSAIGAPLSGSHQVEVRLWDSSGSWSSPSFAEVFSTVSFDDGRWAVTLGAASTLLDHGALDGVGLTYAIAIDAAAPLAPASLVAAVPQAAVAHAVPARATAPACGAGQAGAIYFDTGTGTFLGCYGSDGWQALGASSPTLGTPNNPALSCAKLHEQVPSLPSGTYWIDPNGGLPTDEFEVFCEMSYDDGGWTLVSQGRPISNGALLCTTSAAGALDLDGTTVTGSGKLSNGAINEIWSTDTAKEILVYGDIGASTASPSWDRRCRIDFQPTYAFHVDVGSNAMSQLQDTTVHCDIGDETITSVGTAAPHCGYYLNTSVDTHYLYTAEPSYTGGTCGSISSGRGWPGSGPNNGCNTWKLFIR